MLNQSRERKYQYKNEDYGLSLQNLIEKKIQIMTEVKEKTSVLTGLLGMPLDLTGLERVFPDIVPVYKPTEISYGGKRYILREPLDCEVTLGTGCDTFFIEYEPFLIWGAGYTWDEAVDFFSAQFATVYDLFNEDGEDKLADHYVKILRDMNKLVTNVITW
jgi:hypothetical protein